jgi:hypothetical protein
MRKTYLSKLTWLFLGLVPLLLIACGGGVAAPPASPVPDTDEPAPPTAAPAQPTAEMVEMEDSAGETAVSDEEEILPVSAKPQLIEFYADW